MNESHDQKYGILTYCGPDSIGAAATGTTFLSKHGANILEENTQSLSVDFFTGTLVFSAKDTQMERIKKEVRVALAAYKPIVEIVKQPVQRDALYLKYDLDVVAEDERKIASTIECVMKTLCVNMKAARGETQRTFGCRTTLYRGSFRLEIGNATTLRRLRKALRALEDQRGWEIDLRPEGRAQRRLEVFALQVPVAAKRSVQICNN